MKTAVVSRLTFGPFDGSIFFGDLLQCGSLLFTFLLFVARLVCPFLLHPLVQVLAPDTDASNAEVPVEFLHRVEKGVRSVR